MKKEKYHFNSKKIYLSSTVMILSASAISPIGVTAEEDTTKTEEEIIINQLINEKTNDTNAIENEEKNLDSNIESTTDVESSNEIDEENIYEEKSSKSNNEDLTDTDKSEENSLSINKDFQSK